MTALWRNLQSSRLGLAIVLALFTSSLLAAEYVKPPKGGQYNPKDQTVEMFAAMEKGDIAVQVIPKDSTECNVLIENKSDKPLNVKLPEAFAAVPVLAQINNRRNNINNGMGGGMNQGMGGGMGGMGGMGGGGMGGMGGGGMFNVPPEKVGKFKVATVCLEHGKGEPRAAIPYEIKPIDSFTTKPGVRELCQSLGNGQIDQRAAQAAAWHLNNDMSWQELAAKQLRYANGTSKPYFLPQEIRGAMQASAFALKAAEDNKQEPQTTPSASDAVSRK